MLPEQQHDNVDDGFRLCDTFFFGPWVHWWRSRRLVVRRQTRKEGGWAPGVGAVVAFRSWEGGGLRRSLNFQTCLERGMKHTLNKRELNREVLLRTKWRRVNSEKAKAGFKKYGEGWTSEQLQWRAAALSLMEYGSLVWTDLQKTKPTKIMQIKGGSGLVLMKYKRFLKLN